LSVHVDAQRRRERLGLVQTANGNVDDIGVASVAAGYVGTAGRAEMQATWVPQEEQKYRVPSVDDASAVGVPATYSNWATGTTSQVTWGAA